MQIVPDKVRGDAGIEFFSVDGCLYQCYAPEEVTDVAKAASGMKAKGARDLQKLITNKDKIQSILQSVSARRWILLCPFLDDKDVVASVRNKGRAIKDHGGLTFLAADFEALVQSQDDFAGEIEQLRLQSLGPALAIQDPTEADVAEKEGGPMTVQLVGKLGRAFPKSPNEQIQERKEAYIRAHLRRENILDSLRIDHPLLWDRAVEALQSEERRLVMVGSGSGKPGDQISDSVARLEASLRDALSNLPKSVLTDIALGTISEWLFRCPLDFPENS